MLTVTSTFQFNELQIKINGVLHISFVRSKLLSVYSWHMGTTAYFIELAFDGNTTTLEYNEYDLWVAVLNELEKQL